MHTMRTLLPVAALSFAAMGLAQAGPASVSGAFNGMNWTASKMLTGVTNTQSGGPIVNGGDPIYWPSYPRDSGVVHLLMDYGGGNQFICSGTLLNDRRSILTAGHCVSDGAGTPNPLSTTIFFQPPGGVSPGTRIQTGGIPNGGAVTRNTTQYFVNPGYTGEVIDHNDIAVLRMDADAPAFASSYGLYTNNDLEGKNFTVHGYGRLGDGATGANNFAARLRNGDNEYDYMLGNPVFGTNWATVLGDPFSQIQYSIVSDFDNGLAANDTTCIVSTNAALGGAAGAQFCDLGRGAREVGVSGGDSGGPSFIDDLISSVNSYGLTFGPDFGDVGPACLPPPAPSCLNSSFGEFSGYVPVWLHAQWINSVMIGNAVPVPSSLALMFGAGLVTLGASRRRRT